MSTDSPQNATSRLLCSNSDLITSKASTNWSKVQPSLNLLSNKKATTLVDMIGVDTEQSVSERILQS